MVRLFCTDGKGVFPVDIDEKKEVGDLKIAMAGALGYGERVAGLQLFVARKDKGRGAWLTQRDALQGLSDTRDFKPLQFPRVELRYIGLASEDLETVSIADKLEGKGHVHVVVVLPQRQIRIAVNHRYAETISSYMEIADRLKDSEEVRSLSERLMNLKMQGPPTPFVVLENSSGMGKTQMAFNLEARGECEVFYIVCGMLGDREQIVYKAFAERTVTFQTCVERDLKVMKEAQGKQGSIDAIGAICGNTTLALYGFILAALHGSDQCLGNVHRSHIEDVLDRRAEIGAKPFVFFLDEFPRVRRTNAHFDEGEQRERENELRTMINVFRSFDLAVVVSSTNATARNLLTTSDRSRETGRSIWCVVFPSLPRVRFNWGFDFGIPTLLMEIIKHSRPLFAEIALKYVAENP